ncbi:hypothetical protein M0812_23256 [Anaeramoeba flamelloides]|uniref:Uncharacterized protein n=1 Tax=Anaeramoeba flamelloides TaxID=1746091 RepID=A0AAV7YS29_9EUKA|nr:hypothetical protein M0812_23256 [Anaeramoeba flamelloides]
MQKKQKQKQKQNHTHSSDDQQSIDYFKLVYYFGIELYFKYPKPNIFNLKQAINGFLENYSTEQQKNLKKQLLLVCKMFVQNEILFPNDYTLIENSSCSLNPKWKNVFVNINNNLNKYHRKNLSYEEGKKNSLTNNLRTNSISMISVYALFQLRKGEKTREKLTKSTGYSRQRICSVMSILKGLGIIKEISLKSREFEVKEKQITSLQNIKELNKRVLELRKKRRQLIVNLKQKFGEIEKRTSSQYNEVPYIDWLSQRLQNYYSKSEKYFYNYNNNKISKDLAYCKEYQTSLPFPDIPSYSKLCYNLNGICLQQFYKTITQRFKIYDTHNNFCNAKNKKIKKFLIIKKKQKITNRNNLNKKKFNFVDKSVLENSNEKIKEKNNINLENEKWKNNGDLINTQICEQDDIIHAAYTILSLKSQKNTLQNQN